MNGTELASEYKIGDRVRVLSTGGKIPPETKGNVDAVLRDFIGVRAKVGDHEIVDYFSVTQIEPVISIKAGTGEIERTRVLYDNEWAGTDLPDELKQVIGHFLEMFDSNYSYLEMERCLMSMGFNFNIIRKAFKLLTGIRAEDAVNFNYQFSPGTIPGFNLGWGEAKKGGGYYFIMPGVTWYSIMCQEDDMNRTEVSQHATLMGAIEAIKKMVKKLQRWNPPFDEMDLPKKHVPRLDPSQMYRQPQLFMEAGAEFVEKLERAESNEHREMITRAAFVSEQIGEQTYDSLMKSFADAEEDVKTEAVKERLDEIEKEQIDQPIQNELAEKTPQQFFDRKKVEHRYSVVPADVVASVIEYINDAGARMRDFELAVHSLKYSTIQPAGTQQSMPGDEPDIMNATASVSILLEIIDNKTPDVQNRKLGLMVFSVIRDNIFTTDTIKGEDNWIYALTDEGLAKYFDAERQMTVGRK